MAKKCEWCGKIPEKKGWVLCNKCSAKQNREETARFVKESGIFG